MVEPNAIEQQPKRWTSTRVQLELGKKRLAVECNHVLKRAGRQHLEVMVIRVRRNARENLKDSCKAEVWILPRQIDVEVRARNCVSLYRAPPLFNPGSGDRICSCRHVRSNAVLSGRWPAAVGMIEAYPQRSAWTHS
jgi:hypothetical protein